MALPSIGSERAMGWLPLRFWIGIVEDIVRKKINVDVSTDHCQILASFT